LDAALLWRLVVGACSFLRVASVAYGLHAVAFLTTGSALVASSRHARSFDGCRVCAIWWRRGASASFRRPWLRWCVVTIMLRRHNSAVYHIAQSRVSWPSAIRVRSVAGVKRCSISATIPCRLDGEERDSRARRSSQPSVRRDPQRSSLPFLGHCCIPPSLTPSIGITNRVYDTQESLQQGY
jgi:hypothetical protein